MSRSGYSDDSDGLALIRWRGAVKQAGAIRWSQMRAWSVENLKTPNV